jgi:hypothetical protein
MIYLIYMVSRVNLEQMDMMPDYISALGAASIPHGGTTQVWGSARALLDASATLLLVEVRGSGRSPRRFANFQGAANKRELVGSVLRLFQVRVFWRVEPAKYRYPLALVGLRSKTSLDTYLAPSRYRLGSTGKMPAGLTVKNGCVTRKALVPNALFLQFPGGSWQIANSAVSRSFYSWRFAQV